MINLFTVFEDSSFKHLQDRKNSLKCKNGVIYGGLVTQCHRLIQHIQLPLYLP